MKTAALAAAMPLLPPARPVSWRLLECFNYSGVRLLDGPLKQQYSAMRDFYYRIPDDDMLKGFRERAGMRARGKQLGGWYSGEPGGKEWWSEGDCFHVFGQWLGGMARMARATGDAPMADKAVRLMREWGKTIEPDGYFFYSRKPHTPHYIYDKMAGGLLDLYQYLDRREALALLDKITGWAAKNLDRARQPATPADFRAGDTDWYTLPENIYRAYLLTGGALYKNFAELWLHPSYWKVFDGSAEPDLRGLHACSHINALNSAAIIYLMTGESQYRKTLVNAYNYLERTQLYPTGGFGPDQKLVAGGSLGKSLDSTSNSFEAPCGCWVGFRLASYLMQFTGEARYGDWIEKLLYNGIAAALPPLSDGSSFFYADYRFSGGQKVYYKAAWPCCSGSYCLAVTEYHNLIYFKDDAGLYVNLFVPSEVTWQLNGQDIRLAQQTGYPESDVISWSLQMAKPVLFSLRFRVPAWSRGTRVQVNGSPVEVACRPGTWATIERTWQPGDQVGIQIPMEPVLAPIDAQHPQRVALVSGPLVFVRVEEQVFAPVGRDLSKWAVSKRKEGKPAEAGQLLGTMLPLFRAGRGTTYWMHFDT